MTRRYPPLTGLICLALATSGFAFTSISPMLPVLSAHYAIEISAISLLLSGNSLGFVLFTTLYGLGRRNIHPQRLLSASLIGLGVCCNLLSLSDSFVVTCLLMTLMGGCMGLVQSLGLAMGSFHSGFANRFSHIGMMFYGIGALLGPLLVSAMMLWGLRWQLYFHAVGVLLLLEGLLLLRIRFENKANGEIHHAKRPLSALRGNTLFWLMCLCMALYCAAEVGSWGMLSTYLLEERGFSPMQSGIAVAVFWCGIILGRAASGWLESILPQGKMIQWSPVMGAAVGLLAFFPAAKWMILLCIGLLGFLLAGIWPSIASLAAGISGENRSEAYSLLIAAGGMGSVLGPFLQGLITKFGGMTIAMLQPVFLLVGVAIVIRYTQQKRA